MAITAEAIIAAGTVRSSSAPEYVTTIANVLCQVAATPSSSVKFPRTLAWKAEPGVSATVRFGFKKVAAHISKHGPVGVTGAADVGTTTMVATAIPAPSFVSPLTGGKIIAVRIPVAMSASVGKSPNRPVLKVVPGGLIAVVCGWPAVAERSLKSAVIESRYKQDGSTRMST